MYENPEPGTSRENNAENNNDKSKYSTTSLSWRSGSSKKNLRNNNYRPGTSQQQGFHRQSKTEFSKSKFALEYKEMRAGFKPMYFKTGKKEESKSITHNITEPVPQSRKNLKDPHKLNFLQKDPPKQREFTISFKFLQQVLEKESSEILKIFKEKQSEFVKFLNSTMKPDIMVLALKLLSKVGDSGFDSTEGEILSFVCNSEFIINLQHYIMELAVKHESKSKHNMLYYDDVNSFWVSFCNFVNNVLVLLPQTACNKFYELIHGCDLTLMALHSKNRIENSIVDQFKKVLNKFNCTFEEHQRKKKMIKDDEYDSTNFPDPPENFRALSIFPEPTDILDNEKVYLRPNIKEGAYASVEHYLDVQFRLLREDFINPLREGVTNLLKVNDSKKQYAAGVRIYKKTKFVSPYIAKNAVGVLLDFKTDKRLPDGKLQDRIINWEQNKRFLFGSLLCFTCDKFKTLVFGTVVERDIQMLKNGYILVNLCDEYAGVQNDLYNNIYWMVESEVYFEPYFHVLKALKRINELNFPMQKYLVDVQCESFRPQYLVEGVQYVHNGRRIPVLDLNLWPTAYELDLNDSQYKALQLALTTELAIIQGPPGTGKTYLGLKVASILLKNLLAKKMLVVCYTNHALDQFLEGLIPVTDNIIRVGNRSKNEKLNKFNLRNMRLYSRDNNSDRVLYNSLKIDLKKKINDMKMLDANNSIIDIFEDWDIHYNDYFRRKPKNLHFAKFVYWMLDIDIKDVLQISNNNKIEQTLQTPNVLSETVDESEDEDFDYERVGIYYEEEDDDFSKHITDDICNFICLVNKEELYNDLQKLESKINNPVFSDNFTLYDLQKKIIEYREKILVYDKLTECLHEVQKGKLGNIMNIENIVRDKDVNLFRCNKQEKWSVYKFYLRETKIKIRNDISNISYDMREITKRLDESCLMDDLHILRKAHVIGMTTTSAARLQPAIKELRIPIVIIEEAAEVPESHIITSLTKHCEHLILIGDHLQLKPSTATYKLARKFNLDISLFERMLNNKMHCVQLNVQHRMRPEILNLICPSIYSNLRNHSSVLEFPKVTGVEKSLFFIKHNEFEDKSNDEDNITKKNSFEASFIVRLCKYLCLQGYDTEDITILTTYMGQMYLIKQKMKHDELLKGVKVTVVDNFQGEENKIILLSLVRSNSEARIGFLKTENRVCVALSRAKIGLYIIGNMDNLVASSKIWPMINDSLEKMEAIDTQLNLQCQIHIDQFTTVSCADDFNKVPEGGCRKICKTLIKCGHYCNSVCHVIDREHVAYKCKELCARSCKREHPCKNLCFESCSFCDVKVSKELKCGHVATMPCGLKRDLYNCNITVSVILTSCKHEVSKPCYIDSEKFPCTFPCLNRLECGHKCELNCHVNDDPDHMNYKCTKPCAKFYKDCSKNEHKCEKQCFEPCPPCSIQVKKYYQCSHYEILPCSEDISKKKCTKPCKRTLDCGHHCKLKCYETCDGCKVKVDKTIPECGHTVRMNCSETPALDKCFNKCKKKLLCGHHCNKLCRDTCTSKCEVIVKSHIKSPCGHYAYVPCYLLYSPQIAADTSQFLSNCLEKCNEFLQCGHKCAGTCSKCFQGKIHVPCQEKCGNTLICQHSCKVDCREYCPPCEEKCSYECEHSKCPKKCGEPCVKCQENCTWSCEHKKCSKKCGDICDRDPCNEPCKKKLNCGHDCIGLCGEKCPSLCRICNEEEVKTIFFGNEDEDDARFIMLDECGHIFEREGLDNWFSGNHEQISQEIALKKCPGCSSTINKTKRFSTACKTTYQKINECKMKLYGHSEANNKRCQNLHEKINKLTSDSLDFSKASHTWKKMINYLTKQTQLKFKGRRQNLNCVTINKLESIYNIMTKFLNLYNEIKNQCDELNLFLTQCENILSSMARAEYNISEQLSDDVDREMSRLHWITELYKIYDSEEYKRSKSHPTVQGAKNTCTNAIMCMKKFTNNESLVAEAELNNLLEVLNSALTLSSEEKSMIVRAMNLKSGHWYSCPNNHIYCITECGGPMQEAKCPECKETIGGSNHRLLSTNRVATEMDGAVRPAWPQ